MRNTFLIILTVFVVASFMSCRRSVDPSNVPTQTRTENASLHSGVQAEFLRFDADDDTGRVADFTLNNKSSAVIAGFRGTIVGKNSSGETVYEFPWSRIAIPHIVEAGASVMLENVGFEIPDEVVEVQLVFNEFDLVKQ